MSAKRACTGISTIDIGITSAVTCGTVLRNYFISVSFLPYTPILKEVDIRYFKSMMKHLAFQLIKRDLVCKFFIEISAPILSRIYSLGSIKIRYTVASATRRNLKPGTSSNEEPGLGSMMRNFSLLLSI